MDRKIVGDGILLVYWVNVWELLYVYCGRERIGGYKFIIKCENESIVIIGIILVFGFCLI